MDDGPEVPLGGGNVAVGVVRVGNTVRKPATASTPVVEALLRHLEAVGFDGAPRFLGYDGRGRQVLEHVEGPMAHDLGPMAPADVRRVGALVRDLHDAVATFPVPDGAVWDCAMPVEGSDLVCHNDVAPWNLVLGAGRWVFVDWDGAAPGTRLSDLGWAGSGFAVVAAGGDPVEQGHRLRALADGYRLDGDDRLALPDAVLRRTRAMSDLLRDGARTGAQPWARLHAEGHDDHWGPAAVHAATYRDRWRAMLVG